MQIGRIKNNSSIEQLIEVKMWMKSKDTSKTRCIFEAFDMEKFFDKEGLIDTLQTMLTKGKISMTDYRIWFKSNNITRISILTQVGETDAEQP